MLRLVLALAVLEPVFKGAQGRGLREHRYLDRTGASTTVEYPINR